jgi:hypothetical protein
MDINFAIGSQFHQYLQYLGITITQYNINAWVLPLFLMPILGLSLRLTLSKCGQAWAATYHNTMTFTMLPVITFVITRVISGNIPLALGMVGALSIVRFRHPVKNSFELVLYFALITIGIASSVRIQYGIGLDLIIIGIIYISWLVNIIGKKFGKTIFPLSFSEGQNYNTLEISITKKVDSLSLYNHLVQEIHDTNENLHIYKFAAPDKLTIIEIANTITDQYESDITAKTLDYI